MPSRSIHIAENQFEKYSMGRLPEFETVAFEEHLLLCQECQERLEESDRFVRVMREATRRVESSTAPAKSRWQPLVWWGVPIAAAFALLIGTPPTRPGAPGQEVALKALRGVESSASGHAAPDRPVTLRIGAEELPSRPNYRMEIVDATGKQIWAGRATRLDSGIILPTGRALPPGQHWVRVFEDNGGNALLREFSLLVKH